MINEDDYGEMARPALCVIEAKDDKFDKGWTQALAEMVASSLLGATTCYGIVSLIQLIGYLMKY